MNLNQSCKVVLCRGGGRDGQVPGLARLRTAAGKTLCLELAKACSPGGISRIVELARQSRDEPILVAACPRASALLNRELSGNGLDALMAEVAYVYNPAPASREFCSVKDDGGRCLALMKEQTKSRTPLKMEPVLPNRKVLIIGNGLSALSLGQDLVRRGSPVTLAASSGRIPAGEPLLDMESAVFAKQAADYLSASDLAVIHTKARLEQLEGEAGRFRAWLRNREGEMLSVEAGAVAVTLGSEIKPAFTPEGFEAAKSPLLPLSRLARLSNSPAHLAASFPSESPLKVGVLLGAGGQSWPAHMEAACHTALRLMEKSGASVFIFAPRWKVAEPGLEDLVQKVRAKGAGLVKAPFESLKINRLENGLRLGLLDPALGREISFDLDILGLEEAPVPDEEYFSLADRLCVDISPTGSIQAEGGGIAPLSTSRKGVFALGDAVGPESGRAQLIQAGQALAAIESITSAKAAPRAGVTIDRALCALCLTCARVCPQGAMGVADRRPEPNPLACTGCGTCAAACPMQAIEITNLENKRVSRAAKAGIKKATPSLAVGLEKEVLLLACRNSAGEALAKAFALDWRLPKGFRLMRLPCAGGFSASWVLKAAKQGYDGVLILGCYPGSCLSYGGSREAEYRMDRLEALLDEAGFQKQRLCFDGLGPNQPYRLMDIVGSFDRRIEDLGFSPVKAGAKSREVYSRFTVSLDADYTIQT